MLFSLVGCGSSGTAGNGENTGTTGNEDWIDLNLTFATFLTEQNPCQGNIATLQEKLDEKMPGKVKITTYANGTLLAAPDIFDGVLTGTCDIGYIQCNMLPARLPLCLMLDYPGVSYNSSGVACKVFKEYLETLQPKELEDVVVLLTQCSGPGSFVTSKKVTKMSDLAGKQIRATSSSAAAVTAYGAVPVTLDIGEVYEALRNGLVDGAYTMFGGAANSNLDEVAKYALITPEYNSGYLFVMNKDVFNSMPQSQQEAFMEACEEAFNEYTVYYQEEGLTTDPSCVRAIQNMEINFLEGEALEEFRQAGANLMEEYAKSLDAKGLEGTKAMNLLRELADKYNKEYTWEEYKACYNLE